MKTITAIVLARGGWEYLKTHPIRIDVPGYMPLSIEVIGSGPRGGLLLSVMHSFVQNGDRMRDPDLVVEVFPDLNRWTPISYRQDSLGCFHEAVVLEGARLLVRSRLVDELTEFADSWDRNLRDQGFLEAATGSAAADA